MQRKKGAEEYHIKRRSTLNQLDAKHYSGAAGVEVDHPKVIRVRSRFIRYKRERGVKRERERERERCQPTRTLLHTITHAHFASCKRAYILKYHYTIQLNANATHYYGDHHDVNAKITDTDTKEDRPCDYTASCKNASRRTC